MSDVMYMYSFTRYSISVCFNVQCVHSLQLYKLFIYYIFCNFGMHTCTGYTVNYKIVIIYVSYEL